MVNDGFQEAGDDMIAMRRALGSSVHLPITIDGMPAVVSYWSKEKNAFTPPAVDFLSEVTEGSVASLSC